MDSRFRQCLEEGKLVKIGIQMDLVGKEIKAAEFDLASAEKSLKEGNPKWATVQAYYSMFHTAKALVYRKGYREKSHACLSIALRALYDLPFSQYRRYVGNRSLRRQTGFSPAPLLGELSIP